MAADSIDLSTLFRDPELRRAFAKAERDNGNAYAVPAPKSPALTGGGAVELLEHA